MRKTFYHNFFRGDYSFEVVSKDEMGDKHGETFPDERIICIRGDVYQRAVNGHGRDRLTIAHEVGHLFLHNSRVVSFCQLSDDQTVPAYEDPEWQANCFAGELLASSYLIKDMKIKDIADKCQVSWDAAKIQLSSTKKQKNIIEIKS